MNPGPAEPPSTSSPAPPASPHSSGDSASGPAARGLRRRLSIIPFPMLIVVFPTTAVILGDSLIYIVLPASAADFGIGPALGLSTAFWLGLALSINRFVRIASNVLAATTYRRFGFRGPFIAATALGATTTLGYGLGSGIAVLLLARALWGVAYSFLRLGAQLTAFEVGRPDTRGRLLAFFNAGSRAGSLLAVTAGAVLADLTSRTVTFSALAALGLLGILVATRAPALTVRRGPASTSTTKQRSPSGYRERAWATVVAPVAASRHHTRTLMLSISLTKFAAAFASTGLVIATISPFLGDIVQRDPHIFGSTFRLVTLAGAIVGVRWFADLALSLPLGHASDIFGRRRTIATAAAIIVGSLVLAAQSQSLELFIFAIVAVFFSGVALETALDAAMGETAPHDVRPEAMARHAAWHDLGSATGPFAGFLIGASLGFDDAYLMAAALIAGTTLAYVAASRRPLQRAPAPPGA